MAKDWLKGPSDTQCQAQVEKISGIAGEIRGKVSFVVSATADLTRKTAAS
jgi:CheY-specific phosphatase CheX